MKTKYVASAAALSLCLLCSANGASAQIVKNATDTQSIVQWLTRWNHFYMDENDARRVLEFKTDRDVRVCDDVSGHGIGLIVKYDDKTVDVKPGDCLSFEARNVTLQPDRVIPEGMDLSGTVKAVSKPS